jgi:hypothetical protein
MKYNINLDNIITIYKTNEKEILNNFSIHNNFINNNRKIKNKYNKIKDKLNYEIIESKLYNKNPTLLYQSNIIQNGGAFDLAVASLSVMGSFMITTTLAYILFKILTIQQCRATYPLIDETKVKSIAGLIVGLLPPNLIPGGKDFDDEVFMEKFIEVFGIIRAPLSIFLAISGSPIGKFATKGVKYATKLAIKGAALASGVVVAGTTSAGDLATGISDKVIGFFFVALDALDTLLAFIETILGYLSEKEVMRLLYDLLNINFKDGAFGVECWLNYIYNTYGKNTAFPTICSIFDSIVDKLVSIVAGIFDMLIPTGGIGGLLIEVVMGLAGRGLFKLAVSKLNEIYGNIPYDVQLLIERPELLKKTLDEIINVGKTMFGLVVKDSAVFDTLLQYTDFFSLLLNKLFTLAFVSLNVLSICATDALYSKSINLVKKISVEAFIKTKKQLKALK